MSLTWEQRRRRKGELLSTLRRYRLRGVGQVLISPEDHAVLTDPTISKLDTILPPPRRSDP